MNGSTKERTAKAASLIEQALVAAGLQPSDIAESGNAEDGFVFAVEIGGDEYSVEIDAIYVED